MIKRSLAARGALLAATCAGALKVTDPGAEFTLRSGLKTSNLGGWYDAADAKENGDKCAWVGESLIGGGLPGQPAVAPIPGTDGRHQGQPGDHVRRAVPVEQ